MRFLIWVYYKDIVEVVYSLCHYHTMHSSLPREMIMVPSDVYVIFVSILTPFHYHCVSPSSFHSIFNYSRHLL